MATSWPARSNRRTQLPPDWPHRRAATLHRDHHHCTTPGCTAPATDVDHIGDAHDHNPTNLRSLCAEHHRQRTTTQGNAARGVVQRSHRPREPHPGLTR